MQRDGGIVAPPHNTRRDPEPVPHGLNPTVDIALPGMIRDIPILSLDYGAQQST